VLELQLIIHWHDDPMWQMSQCTYSVYVAGTELIFYQENVYAISYLLSFLYFILINGKIKLFTYDEIFSDCM
jgi:hypothetical protein